MTDMINHPPHYRAYGVECVDVIERLPTAMGSAIGYIWRFPFKNGQEDLNKALWWIQRALEHQIFATREDELQALNRFHEARDMIPTQQMAILMCINGSWVSASHLVNKLKEEIKDGRLLAEQAELLERKVM